MNLEQAAQTIKESYFVNESINVEEINKELTNYLEELVEEINNDPLYFFRENHQFWKKLDKVALNKEKQSERLKEVA